MGSVAGPTPVGYVRDMGGCVMGHNINPKRTDFSLQECADLCDSTNECVAFEFGVDYGADPGGSVESARDCHMQSSDDSEGCNGCTYNNDLYIMDPNYVPPLPTTEPTPTPLTAVHPSTYAPISFAQSQSYAPISRVRALRDEVMI